MSGDMTKIFDISPDKIDRALIALLRENARAPISDLARTLGLSRTTVQSRLERLERSRRITGYTVRLSEAHERGQIQAYVAITVHPKQAGVVAEQMKRMEGVRRLQSVSGPADMIALVDAPSAAEMDALIDAVGALEGVERTTSSIVLGTKFDR
jgi:DNA-binding Lrp family transcriptional regulator